MGINRLRVDSVKDLHKKKTAEGFSFGKPTYRCTNGAL